MEKAAELIEDVMNDYGIPRNIKSAIEECLKDLETEKESDHVKISTLISTLDESSNDPNITLHARTKIWDVVSKLEELNRKT